MFDGTLFCLPRTMKVHKYEQYCYSRYKNENSGTMYYKCKRCGKVVSEADYPKRLRKL